jgi:hypothetical protein
MLEYDKLVENACGFPNINLFLALLISIHAPSVFLSGSELIIFKVCAGRNAPDQLKSTNVFGYCST